MENDKKKKRNKKKKNKQTKTSEDEINLSESTSVDDNHVRNGQSDHNEASETVDPSHQHNSGAKDAAFEETIEHLRKENDLLAHNKARIEDTIKHLHEENNFHMQKVAGLELNLVQLKGEKHSWLQKEAELKEKNTQLQEEKTALSLERARLLEKIDHLEREKASLIIEENSSRETIVGQSNIISGLQAKVVESEECRHGLLQENKLLMENVADYQSKILNLEGRISSIYSPDRITKEALSSQVDSARVLVDKLITENAELIGKVNELFVELQMVKKIKASPAIESDKIDKATTTANLNDPVSPSIQDTFIFGERLDTLESVPIDDHNVASNIAVPDDDSQAPEFSMGEIVQIPLHENEDERREVPVAESDEDDVVLLSDSPLIGAPYRLISFMAKYVSGADLVSKK